MLLKLEQVKSESIHLHYIIAFSKSVLVSSFDVMIIICSSLDAQIYVGCGLMCPLQHKHCLLMIAGKVLKALTDEDTVTKRLDKSTVMQSVNKCTIT